MAIRMVSDGMPFPEDPFYQVRVRFSIFTNEKKNCFYIVFLEYIQYNWRKYVVWAIVKSK